MKKNIIFSILILTFLILGLGCKSDNSLTKLTETEVIALIEGFNRPKLDGLTIINPEGTIISTDSMYKLSNPEQYAMDYFKAADGKIIQGLLRPRTEKDEALEQRVFKVELTQEEIDTIINLTTSKLKETYLANLWDKDQAIRIDGAQTTASKYGWHSEEHKKHMTESIKADKKVFKKMKLFLETHSYPKETNDFHWKAKNSFPTIVGHNHNFDEQLELLPHLITAHNKGHCDLSEIIWLLGEMHEAKFRGKRLEIGAADDNEAFDKYIKVLGLDFEIKDLGESSSL